MLKTCPFKNEKLCLYALDSKCQFEFRKSSECFLLKDDDVFKKNDNDKEVKFKCCKNQS